MSKHLNGYVLVALKVVVQVAKFISITINEVVVVDDIAWIDFHVYAMES